MKTGWLLTLGVLCGLGLVACVGEQPIDDASYRQTRGVAWSKPSPVASENTLNGDVGARAQLNKQSAPDRRMAIPESPEKKLQCLKTGQNEYTCRIGQYRCGTGCRADGSRCRYGYCLKSDCDNVMGQQWDLVYMRSQEYHVCQHPSEKVYCYPNGTSGGNVDIKCYGADGYWCGSECNKNGTQCARGSDTCWAKYHDVQ